VGSIVSHLRQQLLHLLVLVDQLLRQPVALGKRPSNGRIEDLFLDPGMDRELADDLAHQLELRPHLLGVPELLEPVEQLLDVPVILREHGQRVGHRCLLSWAGSGNPILPPDRRRG